MSFVLNGTEFCAINLSSYAPHLLSITVVLYIIYRCEASTNRMREKYSTLINLIIGSEKDYKIKSTYNSLTIGLYFSFAEEYHTVYRIRKRFNRLTIQYTHKLHSNRIIKLSSEFNTKTDQNKMNETLQKNIHDLHYKGN